MFVQVMAIVCFSCSYKSRLNGERPANGRISPVSVYLVRTSLVGISAARKGRIADEGATGPEPLPACGPTVSRTETACPGHSELSPALRIRYAMTLFRSLSALDAAGRGVDRKPPPVRFPGGGDERGAPPVHFPDHGRKTPFGGGSLGAPSRHMLTSCLLWMICPLYTRRFSIRYALGGPIIPSGKPVRAREAGKPPPTDGYPSPKRRFSALLGKKNAQPPEI